MLLTRVMPNRMSMGSYARCIVAVNLSTQNHRSLNLRVDLTPFHSLNKNLVM